MINKHFTFAILTSAGIALSLFASSDVQAQKGGGGGGASGGAAARGGSRGGAKTTGGAVGGGAVGGQGQVRGGGSGVVGGSGFGPGGLMGGGGGGGIAPGAKVDGNGGVIQVTDNPEKVSNRGNQTDGANQTGRVGVQNHNGQNGQNGINRRRGGSSSRALGQANGTAKQNANAINNNSNGVNGANRRPRNTSPGTNRAATLDRRAMNQRNLDDSSLLDNGADQVSVDGSTNAATLGSGAGGTSRGATRRTANRLFGQNTQTGSSDIRNQSSRIADPSDINRRRDNNDVDDIESQNGGSANTNSASNAVNGGDGFNSSNDNSASNSVNNFDPAGRQDTSASNEGLSRQEEFNARNTNGGSTTGRLNSNDSSNLNSSNSDTINNSTSNRIRRTLNGIRNGSSNNSNLTSPSNSSSGNRFGTNSGRNSTVRGNGVNARTTFADRTGFAFSNSGGGLTLGDIAADSLAARAGFESGDQILSINGTDLSNFRDFSQFLRQNNRGLADFLVDRDGTEETVSVNLRDISRALGDNARANANGRLRTDGRRNFQVDDSQ